MKIIGKVDEYRFLCEVSVSELRDIVGNHEYNPKVGSDVNVGALWQANYDIRARHRNIAELSKRLREQADKLDKVNATLAVPVVKAT